MTARTGRFVTFDLDGTLVRSAFESWIIPEIGVRLANGHPSGDAARLVVRRHLDALARGDALEAYDWQAHADAVAREAGLPRGTVDVAALVDWHTKLGKVQLIHEDAPAVLSELRRLGWHVVVLTNGFRRYQEPVLRLTGLWESVDRVITTDDVGHAKPDHRAFAAAFGSHRPAIHVGDRLDHDIQGANRVSALSLLLSSDAPCTGRTAEFDPHERDLLIAHLRTLSSASQAGAGTQLPPDMIPDAVAADVTELPALLEELSTPHKP